MPFATLLLLKLELAGEERSARSWYLEKRQISLVKLLEKRLKVRTLGFSSLYLKEGSSLMGKISFKD